MWKRSGYFRRWVTDGNIWLAARIHRNWAGKSAMAASVDKVDAMQRSDGELCRKDCYVCRYIASPFLLGRKLRAFLWGLPALFHGYLAAVLSGPRTPSLHPGHGHHCKRLLSSRCCVGDHER